MADESSRVLIVDDDPDMRILLGRWIADAGMNQTLVESGEAALASLDIERPDIVLTDLVMDGMSGLKLLREIHRVDPVMPVIIVSGQAEIGDAMTAAHLGVSAFLTKPVDREILLETLRTALRKSGAHEFAGRSEFAPEIVHGSTAMATLLDRARLVARAESSVLIQGATGTGKELLARAIHDASARGNQPFISVNCSAIPDQLLESELFGHERGAFTGATTRHVGLFKAADRGTLFLDEIGDMPLGLQTKLLRVLQDFQVRPVGAVQSLPVDVRILSATHQDLEESVAKGEFREDLYYRLSVVPLFIPPLAERREDIWPIVHRLLDRVAERHGTPRKRFAPGADELIVSASWPGNVRQLANVVEQCCVLSPSEIIPLDLVSSALSRHIGEIQTLDDAKRGFERRYLVSVLRLTEGNVSNAARIAGRNRTEFYKLLSKHSLDAAAFRDSS